MRERTDGSLRRAYCSSVNYQARRKVAGRTLQRVIMKTPAPLGREFDDFLFAPMGEDEISVLGDR